MAKMSNIPGASDAAGRQPGPQFMEHIYQMAISHDETLRRWEEEQEHDVDPEMARKLAAMRTEFLRRGTEQRRGE